MNTWSPGMCGKWARVAECEACGHQYAKILYCNREWCPVCGADWSDSHKARFAGWLPKAQKLSVAGYLVITTPMDKRDELRDVAKLRAIRRSMIRGLKYRGYGRGLSRWHWFGDKYPAVWYPHLNIILDRGRLSPDELADIKAMAAKVLGVPMAVVYYHYTRSPHRIVHWLRYITRATFLDCNWDSDMADNLYKFTNTHSWGDWDSLPDRWYLPSMNKIRQLAKLEQGICPECGGRLYWYGDVDRVNEWLLQQGFVDYYSGWLHCRPP